MGEEKGPDFYNEHVKNATKPYDEIGPFKRSLYEKAKKFINNDMSVIDLGCGAGRFANTLFQRGHKKENYLGIDFADKLIGEAKKRIPYNFVVSDIKNKKFKGFDTFVILEVLEHIEDDKEVLENIPKGSNVLFSVPSYMSPSHVRRFKSEESVYERYKDILEFIETVIITNEKSKKKTRLYLCWCRKK